MNHWQGTYHIKPRKRTARHAPTQRTFKFRLSSLGGGPRSRSMYSTVYNIMVIHLFVKFLSIRVAAPSVSNLADSGHEEGLRYLGLGPQPLTYLATTSLLLLQPIPRSHTICLLLFLRSSWPPAKAATSGNSPMTPTSYHKQNLPRFTPPSFAS
jgi:hypothetical protein